MRTTSVSTSLSCLLAVDVLVASYLLNIFWITYLPHFIYCLSLIMPRREKLSCGLGYHAVGDVRVCLDKAHEQGFDFITIPLVHPRFRRTFGPSAPDRSGLFTRSDMVMKASDWNRFVVGKVSPWIEADSESNRSDSEKALVQELGWASHLGLPAVEIPLLSANCVNLASILNRHLACPSAMLYWMRVPLMVPGLEEADEVDEDAEMESQTTWHFWDKMRRLCRPSQRLCVALEITSDLPSASTLARWIGEPIRAVILSTDIFLTNAKGYPVLSKAHQAVVRGLLKLDPQFILRGNPGPNQDIFAYLRYLQHMFKTQPELGPVEKFAVGYEDYLQAPLQPLMDNLESQTYETFEKDPIKYSQYKLAVKRALLDRVPEDKRATLVTVVMVVGAGRGPLVQCSLEAATEAGCLVRVYAVEKNPNAVVTLEARNVTQWEGKVTIISCDMRRWNAPEKADIMVSELLGSFGDNELSPECLDGAQGFLAENGISIPSDSTSFLTPLSAHKIHTELLNAQDSVKQLQTPYVVMLHNHYRLCEVQPVFRFIHPNPENNNPDGPDNSRYRVLKFPVRNGGTIHGFAGYFESTLYKDVMISINPPTHSPGMFSWFPIYFPLLTSMYIPDNSVVEIHIWRKVANSKVWYEWCVASPAQSPIHNVNGEAYFIGL
eukprot:m.218638 g.218638  ORF g.218638 m.218638 type:complete len:663 (+) comp15904_c0_seq3:65-2053(+)